MSQIRIANTPHMHLNRKGIHCVYIVKSEIKCNILLILNIKINLCWQEQII